MPEIDGACIQGAGAIAAGGGVISSSTGAIQRNEPGPVLGCRVGQLIVLNEQQMAKLRSELDLVQGNMRVFSEMLAAHSTGINPQDNPVDRALADDLELLTVSCYDRFIYHKFFLFKIKIVWRKIE